MPVDRALKKYSCDYPGCLKAFGRISDQKRHRQIHCGYEERRFGCPFEGCAFRANQHVGLKCHISSQHENVRLQCSGPGCEKTFSDPSSLCKHRQKFHRAQVVGPSSNHNGSGSHIALLSTTNRRYATPYERHHADDVQNGGLFGEQHTQSKHQAFDANPETAPMAPNALALRGPGELTSNDQSGSQRSHPIAVEGDPSSSSGGSVKLAPLREDWMRQRATGRPLSDHWQRSLPPNNFHSSSSAYFRPNPQILFRSSADSTLGTSFSRY